MNIALVLSGGTGTRLGMDRPKQYIRVNGRMILSYCVETLFSHEQIDAVQIVADAFWEQDILAEMKDMPGYESKYKGIAEPGGNRQLSIYHGLRRIREYAGADSSVLIHDAARPLVTGRQITECLEALEGYDGVMPALPMKDTVYISEEGNEISGLLDRSRVFAGQAPELFLLEPYWEACRALLPDEILQINGSTEPAVMAGLNIAMIPGDEGNFKITTRDDLRRFEEIIRDTEKRGSS